MGRDFTPKEHHDADLRHKFSKMPLKVTTDKGETITLYDPEDPVVKEYPNLAFLLGKEHMRDIHPNTLHAFEKTLTQIINDHDAGVKRKNYKDEYFDTVQKWYLGKLDPHFYYNTFNNQLLRLFMIQKMRERKGL